MRFALLVALLFTLAGFLFSIWFLIGTVVFILDASSKIRDSIRFAQTIKGRNDAVALAYRYHCSKCERDSVIMAAAYHGYAKDARKTYYNMGYRWYHLIPDWWIDEPWRILTRQWWNEFIFGVRP